MSEPARPRFSFAFPPPHQRPRKIHYKDAAKGGEESKVFLVNRPLDEHGGDANIEALVDEGHYLLGICAFENWPARIHNPGDGAYIRAFDLFEKPYYQRFVGFMHNFREPRDVFPDDRVPLLEMDFSDYVQVRKKGREKVYDLMYYAGHKIDGKPTTVAWSRLIKQHDLARSLIDRLLATDEDVKICLVHDSFGIDDPRVERFDFLGYRAFLDKIESSHILLVPSWLDASPRVITEALCLDTYVMVNPRISGGWKYVNPVTGAFFEEQNAVEVYRALRARGPAETRAWFLRNYANHVLEDRWNNWLNGCILAYSAFNRFGRVFYLSPDDDEKRHRAIQRELFRRIGIYGDCVERVPAALASQGSQVPGRPHEARALSHLAALRRAKGLELPDVVIFEDDFQFIVPREVANRKIGALLEAFPSWDALLFGNHQMTAHEATCDARFLRVRGASVPHGYAVRARLYDTLIAGLEAAREADDGGAKLDAVWTEVAKASNVFAFRDPLGDGLPRLGGPGGEPERPGTLGRVDASCADPALPEEPGNGTTMPEGALSPVSEEAASAPPK